MSHSQKLLSVSFILSTLMSVCISMKFFTKEFPREFCWGWRGWDGGGGGWDNAQHQDSPAQTRPRPLQKFVPNFFFHSSFWWQLVFFVFFLKRRRRAWGDDLSYLQHRQCLTENFSRGYDVVGWVEPFGRVLVQVCKLVQGRVGLDKDKRKERGRSMKRQDFYNVPVWVCAPVCKGGSFIYICKKKTQKQSQVVSRNKIKKNYSRKWWCIQMFFQACSTLVLVCLIARGQNRCLSA